MPRFLRTVFLALALLPWVVFAKTWQIGILAIRGEAHMFATWQPWVDWLNTQFDGERFVIYPLSLNHLVDRDIDKLDFILSNQSQFFYLNDHDVRWLVTLNAPHNDGGNASYERIGSAIIVRRSSPYHQLADLKNQTLSAVGETAFGGFLLGYRELYRQGLREGKNITFIYTGFPVDDTILRLKDGEVAGAIAPVCILEQLDREGKINMDAFRVLAPKANHLGCAASTELLPNWSLAALPQVPDALAAKLIKHLLNDSPSALPQWAPPFSTTQADKILREIHRHPQQNVGQNVKYWLTENKNIILLIMLFIIMNYIWITYQVHRKGKALAQAYQEMRRYEQQLIKADRLSLLGEMTAGIGHEINQPLAAIRMYAEGMKKQTEAQDPDNRLLPILDKILLQVDRSTQIMHNLTAWVKGKNKDNALVSRIVLYDLLQETSQFICKNSAKNIVITLDCDKDITLESKKSMLEEVICNCLLNAIQADADHITLQAQRENTHIVFNIIDNGRGFEEEELNFPFVPFRSSKQDGLGLGLVICKRLIQQMQGSVSLANRAGRQGAVVRFVLPVSLQQEEE